MHWQAKRLHCKINYFSIIWLINDVLTYCCSCVQNKLILSLFDSVVFFFFFYFFWSGKISYSICKKFNVADSLVESVSFLVTFLKHKTSIFSLEEARRVQEELEAEERRKMELILMKDRKKQDNKVFIVAYAYIYKYTETNIDIIYQ